MISPGFTAIPNDLMEVLLSEALNNTERRILLFIARKTYGFQKNSDQISLTQFENKLKISRPTLVRTLERLKLVKLVQLVRKGRSRLASNEWLIDPSDYQNKLVHLGQLVKSDPKQLVKLRQHTKESITKERNRVYLLEGNAEKQDTGLGFNASTRRRLFEFAERRII